MSKEATVPEKVTMSKKSVEKIVSAFGGVKVNSIEELERHLTLLPNIIALDLYRIDNNGSMKDRKVAERIANQFGADGARPMTLTMIARQGNALRGDYEIGFRSGDNFLCVGYGLYSSIAKEFSDISDAWLRLFQFVQRRDEKVANEIKRAIVGILAASLSD